MRIAILAILMSQAAAAQGPAAVGTPQDLRLRGDYADCTFEAAERLLETDSEAFVVAGAAHLACQDEWRSWMDYHLASDPNHDGVRLMFDEVRDIYMRELTKLIVEMREPIE